MDSTSGSAAGRTAAPAPEQHAPARRWDLVAAVAGLVFTAIVLATIASPSPPGTDVASTAIAADILAHHAGHQWSVLAGYLSEVALLFFLAGVWSRLRRSEERGGLFASAFGLSAGVFTAVLMASEGLYLALVEGAGEAADEPAALRALVLLYTWAGGSILPAGAALMLAAAAGILATQAFPRWLSWLAAVTAVCLLLGLASIFQEDTEGGLAGIAGFVGFLLTLVWVLAASVVLLVRAGRAAPASAPEVHA
jgi:hypothetical protein